jgi:hypothetical protein
VNLTLFYPIHHPKPPASVSAIAEFPAAIAEDESTSKVDIETNVAENQSGVSDAQEEAPTSANQQSVKVHVPGTTWNGDKLRRLGAGKCFIDVVYSR